MNGARVSFRVSKRDPTLLRGKYKLGQGRPSKGFFSRTELGTEPAHTGKYMPYSLCIRDALPLQANDIESQSLADFAEGVVAKCDDILARLLQDQPDPLNAADIQRIGRTLRENARQIIILSFLEQAASK